MRKLSLYTLAITGLVTFASCLKDKDFEDQKYGLQITEVKGVAFPQASSSPLVYAINSQVTAQTIDGPFIALEEDKTPSSDVKVTLQIDPALVTAAGFTPLAPTEFSINTLNVTITAGTKLYDALKITIPNASTLNPLLSYGVGLRISAVDQGYKIAANQREIVIAFNIKNQYDGTYEITGACLRAGDPVLSGAFGPYERDLATSGVSSVQWQGQVLWANGSGSALPGGYEPNVTIDPSTNLVTSVTSPNGAIYATNPVVNTTVVGATQRYDPATKTIYFEYSYGAGPTSRLFSFQAKYLHPRP